MPSGQRFACDRIGCNKVCSRYRQREATVTDSGVLTALLATGSFAEAQVESRSGEDFSMQSV